MSLIGLLTATEKQVHLSQLHVRLIQWHLKNNWRVPETVEKVIPNSQITPPTSEMVDGGRQCTHRSTITPTKTCSANLYRRIKRTVGCSLKQVHCNCRVVPSRQPTVHKLSGTKGRLSGPKNSSRTSVQTT